MRRSFAYAWASPATAFGLILVPFALATGGGARLVLGVIEVHGGVVAWLLRHGTLLEGGASALTLGHVVLGLDCEALNRSRSHERVHVRQYERWGPFFIPAYLLAGFWQILLGRSPYRDNPFEREAFDQGA